jgi:type III pantothenate kinase
VTLALFLNMRDNLLIDIGNSNIKLALSKDETNIQKKKAYRYDKRKFKDEFSKVFRSYSSMYLKPGTIANTGISVTNPLLRKELEEKFKKSNAVFIDNKTSPYVRIKYKSRLGNDRVSSINAAYHLYNKKQILIIDLGTATTLNLIINGEFIGGSIAPGIEIGLEGLMTNTPLPKPGTKFKQGLIFDSTKESIAGGTVQQTIFFIEGAARELREKYKELYVIGTGGYSDYISNHTECFDITDKDLVMKGINVILNHHSFNK